MSTLRKAWAVARALPWSELLHQHFSKDPMKDVFRKGIFRGVALTFWGLFLLVDIIGGQIVGSLADALVLWLAWRITQPTCYELLKGEEK